VVASAQAVSKVAWYGGKRVGCGRLKAETFIVVD
jgi:hypothetical protein